MTEIKRTVSVETSIVDMSEDNRKVNEQAATIYRETWPIRRDKFKEKTNMTITTAEWLNSINKPALILIDGMFVHSAIVYYDKKYVDYRKMRLAFGNKAKEMFYFSVDNEESNLKNFLNYVSAIPGCTVITKQQLPANEPLYQRVGEHEYKQHSFRSVAMDIAINTLREIYENPDIDNVLVFSRDPELIQLFKEIKALHVKVTLVRSPNIKTSKHLLSEANYIIDIYELMRHLHCYSNTVVREKSHA